MGVFSFFGVEQYVPQQYARALLVFIVLLFVFRFALGLLQRGLTRLTRGTKTSVDGLLLEKSTAPVTLFALFLSMRFALQELDLADSLHANLVLVAYTGLVITGAYLIYVFLDIVMGAGWSRVARRSRVPVNQSLTSLVREVLRVVLLFIGLLYVLSLWGVEILPLLGALGIAGLAVALALQPTLSNIFAGVAMILDKSVRVGDWIIFDDDTSGVIQKISLRSTKIRSSDNELIVMPNSKFADSQIRNASLPEPKARVVVPFSVAYGSTVATVKKVVMSELKKVSHFVDEPGPVVRFVSMGPSALEFKAYFHVESFEYRSDALDEANTRIYEALGKARIEIPFPQLHVKVKK